MKKKLLYYIKEIIFVLFFITVLSNALSFYLSADLNKNSLSLGHLMLIDSKKYHFEENKPVIVHFWATWCPTCKVEVGNLERLSKNYNVITFAVNSGSNEDIQKFLDENNLHFFVVNDMSSYYASQFNVKGFPTTFIYDADKNLVFNDVGYTSTLGLYLRAWWASL